MARGQGRFYPIDKPAASPDEYGINAPIVKRFNIPLDNALVNEKFDFGGSSLWAVDASDISAKCYIKLGDQQRDGVPFLRGTQIAGVPFSRLFVDCDAQPGKWLQIVVSTAENISIANPDQAFSEVELSKPSGLGSVADITVVDAAAAAVILAADTTRRSALVGALHANTGAVRVADALIDGGGRGAELAPGESVEFTSTAAIYAFNDSGADQAVWISYETD
jgi:hypothetical protein